MTDAPLVRGGLRWLAIAIAVAAVVDPAFTSSRNARITVAVVASDSRDAEAAALVQRVRSSLDGTMTVIGAPYWAAAATVVVGDRLPIAAMSGGGPVFAVVAGADEPHITIESVELPARVTLDATVPVVAGIRFAGAAGRTVEATLSAGELVVDRATRQVHLADESISFALNAVAGDTGTLPMRVEARVAGGSAIGSAIGSAGGAATDAAVDVRAHPYSVLFYDPRPSFASTFVRRAIERDSRFGVTARSVTSRSLSVDAGVPPVRIDDAAALAKYDVVVVGAPAALNEAAVAGLDAYMRGRGGSVVFLLDERATAPFERLTGARDWRSVVGEPVSVKTVAGTPALRATGLAWPSRLPAGALALAFGDSARPIVWKSPVGAGQVVVSGALDAWRYRDTTSSAFERFWRDEIANAAAHSPPAIAIAAPSAIVSSERAVLGVDLRDVALRARAGAPSVRATVGATLTRAATRPSVQGTKLRLIPSGSIGHFEASFRAPAEPGTYRIDVESGAERASAPLAVRADASPPAGADRAVLEAWVAASGGSVIPSSQISRLRGAIYAAAVAQPRPVPWHPMRSAWWLVAFAAALSAEWWLRRRNALA